MVFAARKVRVFFPCTGLGREARGFETFTRECAAALRDRDDLELTVFGGGGALLAGERRGRSFSRRSASAVRFGAMLRRDPYFVEQASFAASFLPSLVAGDPDVVYFADLNLGNACWHWRRFTGQRYRLLYYNGGATTKPFTRADLVQQVSPEHRDAALARGEAADRQVLLPHGLAIAPEFRPATSDERMRIRAALGVPGDGRMILSVGALSCGEKRMDYVIREVATLPSPRPHLAMLGAETSDTPGIRVLAAELLGTGGFTMRTVTRELALEAYRAADVFVLASLLEGFGFAHVEALAAGLPCVAHETQTTAYLYGPHARRGDLRASGALVPLLAAALGEPTGSEIVRARHAWAYGHFSWDVLRERYVEMFRACAAGRRPVLDGREGD